MPVVEEFIRAIRGNGMRSCPRWPPDLFAVVSALLNRTGAYVRVVGLCNGDSPPLLDTQQWPGEARQIGRGWRQAIDSRQLEQSLPRPPRQVEDWWQVLVTSGKVDLDAVVQNDGVCRALVALATVADETCAGIGMGFASKETFHALTEDRLLVNNSRSFCEEIAPALARVLPKQHAAQRGLTLRSLTHNLALVTPDEVIPIWNGGGHSIVRANRDHDLLSMLLLPWPIELEPQAFQVLPVDDPSTPRPAVPFRYFAFRRNADPDALRRYVEGALAQARRHARVVDILVFPELALTEAELVLVREIAMREQCLLVAGVSLQPGTKLVGGLRGPGNVAIVDLRGWVRSKPEDNQADMLVFPQRKHHRWCLDRTQIEQYGLNAIVPASKDCWEYADIGERKVQFWTIDSWLTFSVLICEDLARQDPVAQVLRAVGPNLVFALLMDGPQLRQRWGARYASVLAEDPGTSVLTLTSLGMSRLSRPREPDKPDRRGVVALWRDVERGEQEIELPPGHDAALLSIVCHRMEEFTCDGRGDGGVSYFPILSGVWPLRAMHESTSTAGGTPCAG